MITVNELTSEQIRSAEFIDTHADDRDLWHTVWGQESVPMCSMPGSAPHQMQVLNVMISDERELFQVMNKVKAVRGRLPRAKQALYDTLQQSFAS